MSHDLWLQVLGVEAIRCKQLCRPKKNDDYIRPEDTKGKPFLKTLVVRCYNILVPFYFGGVMTQLFTDIGKFSVGRLRPHFFEACKPDFSKINCSLGYIEDYTCLATDEAIIRNAKWVSEIYILFTNSTWWTCSVKKNCLISPALLRITGFCFENQDFRPKVQILDSESLVG